MLTGPFKEGRGESEGSDESVCRAAETESAADSLNEHVIAMCAYTCVYVCVYMCVCVCVCVCAYMNIKQECMSTWMYMNAHVQSMCAMDI